MASMDRPAFSRVILMSSEFRSNVSEAIITSNVVLAKAQKFDKGPSRRVTLKFARLDQF